METHKIKRMTAEEFKQYRKKGFTEARPVTQRDIEQFEVRYEIIVHETKDGAITVSISDTDLNNGSPKIGDMIARNPKNHLDQWLIAEEYFNENFEK